MSGKPLKTRPGFAYNTNYPPGRIDEIGEEWLEWLNEKCDSGEVPFIRDFCNQQGLLERQVNRFINKSEIFAYAHEVCKEMQEHLVWKNALYKKLDVTMAKCFLACHHGMKEKAADEELVNYFKEYLQEMRQKVSDETGFKPQAD